MISRAILFRATSTNQRPCLDYVHKSQVATQFQTNNAEDDVIFI